MKNIFLILISISITNSLLAQKDSLTIGSKYAEDHIYFSISYAQFFNQPQLITRSGFSYGLSAGFLKDITLNKQGSLSFALGLGYGFDFYNHELKVEELNGTTNFGLGNSLSRNVFKAQNLEFPVELRWRTSTARKYDFWRIYGGVKFLYNLSNKFQFTDNGNVFNYNNVSAYRRWQYGLTLSAGFDEFNINVFYSLIPLFENANLNGETIDTGILKFGLIFYIL